ncbi:hypothetical protein TNCV_4120411, partial [Trichonephila clavipes]
TPNKEFKDYIRTSSDLIASPLRLHPLRRRSGNQPSTSPHRLASRRRRRSRRSRSESSHPHPPPLVISKTLSLLYGGRGNFSRRELG